MSALTIEVTRASGVDRRPLAFVLMVLSGFAALGYQIVWTQQCALWLGHESAAVLAVVTAFFGGSALGAWTLGTRIEASDTPARWYLGCEVAIGIWGLIVAALLQPASDVLLRIIGPQPSSAWHWSVAFCGTFVLLLPATAAMGATLPAMARVLEAIGRDSRSIALLYAANTLGAVIGVLVAAFELVPMLGLERTTVVCAALNLLCAALAASLSRTTATERPALTPQVHSMTTGYVLFSTGLLGIGYEVIVVRVLSQVAEDTVYTFAILLAVYLVGTALGAATYQRWLVRRDPGAGAQDVLLRALAGTCLLGALTLAGAESIKASALLVLGGSLSAALGAEAALALVAFLLPTFVMGALFSHLCTTARGAGMSFGRALSVNTLGAAAAPIVFGVVLLPWLGSKLACLLVPAGYLLLAAKQARRVPTQWLLSGALLVAALWAPSLAIIDVPAGGRIVHYAEGAMATVSIIEDEAGVARLHINNRQQEGSSATRFADARQGLLPILLHPSPHRALFLGLGTGITASSAAMHAGLQVDAVELLPEVIAASAHFTQAIEGADSRHFKILNADARRFVRATDARYDVIVADNFHPARSGSGALYTVEHFRAVQQRLAVGGIFCQWLPLHQLDLTTLRSIVRAFNTVYPRGWAMLSTNSLETPVMGLVALNAASSLDIEQLRTHLQRATIKPEQFGIPDELALLGNFIAGQRALARFAGTAPLNTDDHPVVAYLAPRITYVPTSTPRERLLSLLHEIDIVPEDVLPVPVDSSLRTRLAAYWRARDHFIEVGRTVQATNDVQRMLAQVREPLLEVLRISPEFRPAYDPLLQMAAALAQIDARSAHALLTELQSVQPARPEAGELLQALSNSPR